MYRGLTTVLAIALFLAGAGPGLAAPAKAKEKPAATTAVESAKPAEPAVEPAKGDATPAPETTPAENPATPGEPDTLTNPEPGKEEPPPPETDTPPPKFEPVKFWPGFVNMGVVTSKPQTWRDLDGLLLEGKFKPEAQEDRPTIDRPPPEGKQYVILSVQVTLKKSIGKYDYVLKTLKGDFPCLAMGMMRGDENAIFDPRIWEIKYETGMELLQLIFEVPAGTPEATLVSALPLTLPPPPVELKLLEDAPPAAPAPAAEPAKDGTEPAAPAAGEVPAAPADAPATPAPKEAPAPATPAPKAAPAK